jgi:HD-GYP domain-containing protein (c-di-GMP phosphodiesterase class II)
MADGHDSSLMHEDPDERIVETVLGPSLVGRLYGLLRAMRIYDPANQAVRDQLREALALIGEILEDEVTLVAMGQCFYVNGTRVRAESSQIQLFNSLSTEFEQRRLGGLRFLEGLGAEELGAFVRLMAEHPDAERAAQLAQAAAGAGISHVVPISLDELESAEPGQTQAGDDSSAAERDRAHKIFRQALHGTKAALLRTARSGKPAIRRVKRVVQPIVDSIMKNEYSIVGLTAIKSHDEYTYAHSVNVSILSIAIGQTLGLSRLALANLGVGALLHDIGKVAVPASVLSKPGKLDRAEWDLMRRHPLEGTKLIMRMPGLPHLMLDALGIALYHHVRCDGGGYPAVVRSGPPPSLARIVAVADCYDAMTTHRAYRARPLTGYEALRTLLAQDPQAFDPAVLWALVQTVGLFPAGTLLQTESGHTVLSLNNDREDLRRPHCQVVGYPEGSHRVDGQPEMWQPMPRHETVARVVPPEEFEVEIDRLLAA